MKLQPEYYFSHYPLIAPLSVIAGAFIIGIIFRFIVLGFLHYNARNGDRFLFESLQRHLKRSLFLFVPCMIMHAAAGWLTLSADKIDLIRQLLQIVIVASIAFIAIRLMRVVQDVLFRRYDVSMADNLKARKARTQIMYINKIATVVIVVISVGIVLLTFDSVRQYGTTILTGAGVAGIIIGFALQKTLANLFAGIQIAFTQPIKIDDAVVVEGEWGWIEEINLTYVVVRIWDMRRLILPITYFTENAFQNWTRSTAQILGSVFLYTDYTMPLDPLRKHFDTILDKTDMWDGQAKAFQVTDCTDHSMTIRLLMTARNSPVAWDLRCYVREEMIRYIQANYPQSLPKTRATLEKDPNKESGMSSVVEQG
ncbi:mechanosensitive ion channel family protein [Vibrio sp.]|uniref:Mechanosensitive ion channel family protein n=1 Tax=Vibrio viridaestus TaxID=2487322 RepID=A0A3N9U166_9VIBR|nr:mechanosensitive ion channel domain-containing protein [Vibrio viridaestus]MDC0611243.1 mechanosensitive ion channel family protein [Vibrio sp.]RQW61506.1 mechanosensitive ion channel family protein [Vibrio viridaestus]